ncbi:MAG: hypothetical protein O3B47_02325 [bacterium]|nr:hypothetical protein [bacterium]
MENTNKNNPVPNEKLKSSLDEVDKELKQFDEIANTIEAQQTLSDLESELNKEE